MLPPNPRRDPRAPCGIGHGTGWFGSRSDSSRYHPRQRRVINREWPILQNRILQETQGYQTPSRHSSTKLVPDIQPVVLRSLHRVDLVQGIRITFLTSPSCKPETHLDVLQWQGYDVGVVFLFPALHALQLSCAATHTSASSHMDCAPLSRMTMWTSTNTLSHSDDKVEHGHMILIALSGSPAATQRLFRPFTASNRCYRRRRGQKVVCFGIFDQKMYVLVFFHFLPVHHQSFTHL